MILHSSIAARTTYVPRDEFRDADGETGTGGDDERRDGVAVHHGEPTGCEGKKEFVVVVVCCVTAPTYVLGVGEYRFKTRKRVRFAEHHHLVFV